MLTPRRATQDEVRRSLPGDDLVPSPKSGYTQAITIRAPKSEVWPWLVQIGYKRAGWYSHDFLHRLVGIAGCVDDERRSAIPVSYTHLTLPTKESRG